MPLPKWNDSSTGAGLADCSNVNIVGASVILALEPGTDAGVGGLVLVASVLLLVGGEALGDSGTAGLGVTVTMTVAGANV